MIFPKYYFVSVKRISCHNHVVVYLIYINYWIYSTLKCRKGSRKNICRRKKPWNLFVSIQPSRIWEFYTQPNPFQPMNGPNPRPSLRQSALLCW